MKSDRNTVEIGIPELDSKFAGGGMLSGTVCLLKSEPNTPALTFLMQIFQNKNPSSHFMSPVRSKQKIKYTCSRLGMNPTQIDGITGSDEITSFEAFTNIIGATDFSDTDVVVINGASSLPTSESEYGEVRDFYTALSNAAMSDDFVVMLNTVTEAPSSKVETHESYIADVQLTLTQTMSPNNLSQTLYLNHLPPGQNIAEKYEDKRVMEIDDKRGKIELSSGGRI